MTVFTYENGERTGACKDFLLGSGELDGCKMLTILPIPSSRDGIFITGSDIPLATVIGGAGVGDTILGYGLCDELVASAKGAGAVVVDAAHDEEFLTENARLTALATLAYLLSDGVSPPDEKHIGIVGYGRIGRALLRLLLPLGVRVSVYTTRREVALCLCESGVDAAFVSEGDPLPHVDILVNTAPARIFEPDGVGAGCVLELASGDNYPELDVTRLSALPARYYPESAGRAYAMALLRAVGGEG